MIDQKFPESGHAYLDSNRYFVQIEKLIKRQRKGPSLNPSSKSVPYLAGNANF